MRHLGQATERSGEILMSVMSVIPVPVPVPVLSLSPGPRSQVRATQTAVELKGQFFQSFTHRSRPPEATIAPSGLQSTAYTSSACPGRSSFSFLLRTSHTCSSGWNLRSTCSAADLPPLACVHLLKCMRQQHSGACIYVCSRMFVTKQEACVAAP